MFLFQFPRYPTFLAGLFVNQTAFQVYARTSTVRGVGRHVNLWDTCLTNWECGVELTHDLLINPEVRQMGLRLGEGRKGTSLP